MNAIRGVRSPRWIVEGDPSVVGYDLDTTARERPVPIAERSCVVDGPVTEIEALFCIHGPGS